MTYLQIAYQQHNKSIATEDLYVFEFKWIDQLQNGKMHADTNKFNRVVLCVTVVYL